MHCVTGGPIENSGVLVGMSGSPRGETRWYPIGGPLICQPHTLLLPTSVVRCRRGGAVAAAFLHLVWGHVLPHIHVILALDGLAQGGYISDGKWRRLLPSSRRCGTSPRRSFAEQSPTPKSHSLTPRGQAHAVPLGIGINPMEASLNPRSLARALTVMLHAGTSATKTP